MVTAVAWGLGPRAAGLRPRAPRPGPRAPARAPGPGPGTWASGPRVPGPGPGPGLQQMDLATGEPDLLEAESIQAQDQRNLAFRLAHVLVRIRCQAHTLALIVESPAADFLLCIFEPRLHRDAAAAERRLAGRMRPSASFLTCR